MTIPILDIWMCLTPTHWSWSLLTSRTRKNKPNILQMCSVWYLFNHIFFCKPHDDDDNRFHIYIFEWDWSDVFFLVLFSSFYKPNHVSFSCLFFCWLSEFFSVFLLCFHSENIIIIIQTTNMMFKPIYSLYWLNITTFFWFNIVGCLVW